MLTLSELSDELSKEDCIFLRKNIGNLSYAANNRETILNNGIVTFTDLDEMVLEYKKLMEKVLELNITQIITILPDEINDKLTKISDFNYDIGQILREYINILIASVNYSDPQKVAKMEAEYKNFLTKFLFISIPDILEKLSEYKPLGKGTDANLELIKKAFKLN